MFGYIAGRLGQMILVILGVTFVTFALMYLSGDPALVYAGVLVRQEGRKVSYLPDNRYLRPIVDGIRRLYGHDTPVALILRTILLHTSITTLQAWPSATPLAEAEEKRYLDPTLLPLLRMLMLADSDGWELFSENCEPFRQETRAVFDRLAAQT